MQQVPSGSIIRCLNVVLDACNFDHLALKVLEREDTEQLEPIFVLIHGFWLKSSVTVFYLDNPSVTKLHCFLSYIFKECARKGLTLAEILNEDEVRQIRHFYAKLDVKFYDECRGTFFTGLVGHRGFY